MENSFSRSNQSGKRRVGFALIFAVALGSCVTTELRAQVVVVPNSLATNDGTTYTTTPPGGPTSVREMQIFDASQFAALSGASFLTQFALRPDMIPNASGPRSVNLRIYASTTTRSVAGLSMTFADNLGADNTLVFSGTLNWATGNLPGPGNTRQFDVVFPFTTPFLYNPAAGNLLLDIQLSGNGQSITFDAVTGNSMARKIVNTSSSNATTAAFVAPNQVIQFTFEPPPLVAPTFSDANWGSMGGISGADNTVSAVVVDGSCNLYIGGEFNLPGEVIAHHVAKWTGSGWTALGSGMSGSDYPYVSALAVSGSNLYAGGSFTTAGGSAANYVAKWDGSSWSALGSGMDGWVMALAVSGSNLYAAGEFSTAGGISATNIAKWNGSSWSALGSGLGLVSDGSFVRALAVSGSDVYVGGHFTTAGASTANYIAKWNGSSWTALGSGMNGTVNALAVSGSTLYAGGSFTTAGGSSTTNRIAKWDGSSWTALDSGSGLVNTNPTDVVVDVRALEVSGSDLYAGGWFTTADGSCKGIAKWDGSSWTALGSGIGGDIYARVLALAVSGSDLYAGGDFTTAGGKASAYTARAYLPSLPTLSVIRSSENVTVSWPAVDTAGFALEQASPLAAPAGWITNSATVTNDGTKKSVTLPAMNSSQFFRLRRP